MTGAVDDDLPPVPQTWRLKVDEVLPNADDRGLHYGPAHHITSEDHPPSEVDELVIAGVLHLEMMGTHDYWLGFGDGTRSLTILTPGWVDPDTGEVLTEVRVLTDTGRDVFAGGDSP